MKVMHFYSYLTFHECYKYCSVSTYRPRNQKKNTECLVNMDSN